MKKMMLAALIIVPAFLIYEFFGNISRAVSAPSLSGGEKKAHFIGYYVIGAGYAVLSAIASLFVFILARKKFHR